MARFGFICLLLYITAMFTRIFELLMPAGNIPKALLLGALVATVVTGRIFATMTPKIGKLWYAFMGWSILGIPFSVWPVGALQRANVSLGRIFILFLGMVALVDNWVRVRVVAASIMLSLTWISIYVLLFGRAMSSGSRVTSRLTSTDPNEMALQMLIALPLWAYFWGDRSTPKLIRWAAFPAAAIAVVVMAKTGSRSMIVAAAAVTAYLFYRVSWKVRIRAGVALAVAGVAFVAAAPPESLARYKTLLGGGAVEYAPQQMKAATEGAEGEEEDQGKVRGIASSAAASASSRMYLLERSLKVTLQNPIFGVGVGMFQVAEGMIAKDEGLSRGMRKNTHNTYTEISSQHGIPALILFLWLLFVSWRKLTAIERLPLENFPQVNQVQRFAFALKISLLSLMTFALALGISYGAYFFVYTGFVVALENTAANEKRRYEARLKAESEKKARAAERRKKLRQDAPPVRPRPVVVTT